MNKETTRAKQSKEVNELIANVYCSFYQNSTIGFATHVIHENQKNKSKLDTPVE